MHFVKTLPTAIVGALGLFALVGISACGKTDQATQAAQSSQAQAQASASDAQAAASDANASAALSRAAQPAAGTVADKTGENDKSPKPTASISEIAQAGGDEAPQELQAKVAAARKAGNVPVKPAP